jgi:hypothetical protein
VEPAGGRRLSSAADQWSFCGRRRPRSHRGEVDDASKHDKTGRAIVIDDDSGDLRVVFSDGRGSDIEPGQLLRITGETRQNGNRPIYINNPTYRVIEDVMEDTQAAATE